VNLQNARCNNKATNIFVYICIMYRLTSTKWQKPCITSHVAGIVLETNK